MRGRSIGGLNSSIRLIGSVGPGEEDQWRKGWERLMGHRHISPNLNFTYLNDQSLQLFFTKNLRIHSSFL
jgi:hypothetical protein